MKLYNQLILNLPYPETSFAGKIVIVTGSNVGLGKEAARHIARLQASKVILAVRNLEAGTVAKNDIVRSTHCAEDAVQVWHLDLASYQSVISFSQRVDRELDRLDVLVANAAVASATWEFAEENEKSITVNVVSTFLLALLLLPKMNVTATRYDVRPVLALTGSGIHSWVDLPERNDEGGSIFAAVNDPKKSDIQQRYATSKLLEVFAFRALVERYTGPVVIVMMCPGFCKSSLTRNMTGVNGLVTAIMKFLLARSTEQGSRVLVHAASVGPETHGAYLSDCEVAETSPFVRSEEGKRTQDRVWKELLEKLEAVSPGISAEI